MWLDQRIPRKSSISYSNHIDGFWGTLVRNLVVEKFFSVNFLTFSFWLGCSQSRNLSGRHLCSVRLSRSILCGVNVLILDGTLVRHLSACISHCVLIYQVSVHGFWKLSIFKLAVNLPQSWLITFTIDWENFIRGHCITGTRKM